MGWRPAWDTRLPGPAAAISSREGSRHSCPPHPNPTFPKDQCLGVAPPRSRLRTSRREACSSGPPDCRLCLVIHIPNALSVGASREDAASPSSLEPLASVTIPPAAGVPLDLLTRNRWSTLAPVAFQEDSAGPSCVSRAARGQHCSFASACGVCWS